RRDAGGGKIKFFPEQITKQQHVIARSCELVPFRQQGIACAADEEGVARRADGKLRRDGLRRGCGCHQSTQKSEYRHGLCPLIPVGAGPASLLHIKSVARPADYSRLTPPDCLKSQIDVEPKCGTDVSSARPETLRGF